MKTRKVSQAAPGGLGGRPSSGGGTGRGAAAARGAVARTCDVQRGQAARCVVLELGVQRGRGGGHRWPAVDDAPDAVADRDGCPAEQAGQVALRMPRPIRPPPLYLIVASTRRAKPVNRGAVEGQVPLAGACFIVAHVEASEGATGPWGARALASRSGGEGVGRLVGHGNGRGGGPGTRNKAGRASRRAATVVAVVVHGDAPEGWNRRQGVTRSKTTTGRRRREAEGRRSDRTD